MVGVDLKTYSGGPIILYVIDFWSKLMQARIVKSKKSEDVVSALLECWISHYGTFSATVHDNGGEFIGSAFTEMVDLLGIEDRSGAAHSTWSYGIVEKHHAVVDKTFEALKRDYPHYKDNTLLQWAITIKNSTTTSTGFSPYQAVFQKNPVLPSLVEASPSMLREEVVSATLMENFNAMNTARIKYNEALADNQIKKMLKAKLRRNQNVFQKGDYVYWKVSGQAEDWRQGKVLAVDGKLVFVKAGSQLYRVHADMTIKKNTEFDKAGKLVTPREVLETQARETAKRKPAPTELLISVEEADQAGTKEGPTSQEIVDVGPDVDDDPDDVFDEDNNRSNPGDSANSAEEPTGEEQNSNDGGASVDTTTPLSQNYDDQAQSGQVSQRLSGEPDQVSQSVTERKTTNSQLSGNTFGAMGDEEITAGERMDISTQMENQSNIVDRAAVRVMI